MPESGQRINDTQENDQRKLNLRNERKRILVADELEQHPVFKTLKVSAADNNINIMLDAIVDKYFEFSSDSNNNLQNQEYYVVSPTLIEMALAQTIYLINKTENGVVLDADGTQNEILSLEQKMMASSTEMKEYYRKLLDEGEKDVSDIFQALDEPKKASEVLSKLSMFSTKEEMMYYLNSAEGKREQEEVLAGKKSDDNISKLRQDSNLETADNVEAMALAQNVYEIVTRKNITSADKAELKEALIRLEAFGGNIGKMIASDRVPGKVDLEKVLKMRVEYARAYTTKENLKILQSYGKLHQIGKNWDRLPIDAKQDVLDAAYALYIQEGGEHKDEALLALSSLGLTDIDNNRNVVLDEQAFLGFRNSLHRGRPAKNIQKVKEEIAKNQNEMVEKQISSLEQERINGTLITRSNESLKNFNGKSELQSNIDAILELQEQLEKNNTLEIDDDIKPYENETKKETFIEKIEKRAKRTIASEKADNLFNGIRIEEDEKFLLMSMAYTLLSNPNQKIKKQLDELKKDKSIPESVKKQLEDLIEPIDIEKTKSPEEMKEISKKVSEIQSFGNISSDSVAQKIQSFTSAYEILQGTDIKKTKEFMEEYMLKNPTVFGKIMEPNEKGVIGINSQRMGGFISNIKTASADRLSEFAQIGVDSNMVMELFSEVAMHKKTPAYMIKGGMEIAKDSAKFLATRALTSKAGKIAFGKIGNILNVLKPKALPEGTRSNGLDKSVIDSISEEYLTNDSVTAVEKRKDDKIIQEQDKPTEPVSEFDERYAVTLNKIEIPDSVLQQKQMYQTQLREEWEGMLQEKGLPKEEMKRMSLSALKDNVEKWCGEEVIQDAKARYQELGSKAVENTQTKNETYYRDDSEDQEMEI